MNKNQALKRAREIWGDGALIQDAKKANVLPNGAVLSERYKVGRYLAGFFSVQGDGKTWEEAFAKARRTRAALVSRKSSNAEIRQTQEIVLPRMPLRGHRRQNCRTVNCENL